MYRLLLHIIFYLILREKQLNIIQIRTFMCYTMPINNHNISQINIIMEEPYNIIPIGDHCAISMILNELNLRKVSYPFDWTSHTEQVHDTNILHNVNAIHDLSFDTVSNVVNKYIGDAFATDKKINSTNCISFPHDEGTAIDIFEKYERRFHRLHQDLSKKNIFVLLTRHYHINEDTFKWIMDILLSYNNNSIILFISGTDHTYFENKKYEKRVIFKHIYYDIAQFYDYDYHTFRPNIKTYLSTLFY